MKAHYFVFPGKIYEVDMRVVHGMMKGYKREKSEESAFRNKGL